MASPLNFIDLKKDYAVHAAEYDAAMQQVCRDASFVLGPAVRELEAVLSKFVGVKHCVTVGNGTIALQIALLALGVGSSPDDEVITVPFTWISTPHAVSLVGAKPVFVDIDPANYCMDVNKLEAAITLRTKAIMPVSLFGQMPDYEKINTIANKYGIPVIEDAAQSFGAEQRGRRSCGVTTIGCTSFYPAKPLGCFGEGGAIFTNDETLAQKCRMIRTNGAEVRHNHLMIGYNGRLETLQAAVLLVKMKYFLDVLRSRAELGAKLTTLLQRCNVLAPAVVPGNTHTYAQYTIRVANRDEVAKQLASRGVPTSVYYPRCCHLQPCYTNLGYKSGSLPIAEALSQEVLSLPFHPYLEEHDLVRISEALYAIVGEGRHISRLNLASYVHPSAIVDANVAIGEGTKLWHFVHVSKDATIGNHCNFGQNVYIGVGVKIGDNVRAQNNVSIYSGVEIQDDVSLGPSMVFTNDLWPRSGIAKPYEKTLVKKGASIGANATIVCGNTIEAYSFIGAGAVITKSTKPFGLYVGNPAHQIGWVSKAGEKLDLPLQTGNQPILVACKKEQSEKYRLQGNIVELC